MKAGSTDGGELSTLLKLTASLLALLFMLSSAWAADRQPSVDELIRRAIASLENTSYEGRMRYSDPYGNGSEKLVEITFLSPSSFRVQPLLNEKQRAGYYFIENSERLVKIYSDNNALEEMPSRQYIYDNQMRRRLLEMIAGRPTVSLLHGNFNGEPVWILRDEGVGKDEYSITIHISERNDYPISLQMNDRSGASVQYYELDEVKFLTDAEIDHSRFQIPVGEAAPAQKSADQAPRIANVVIPDAPDSAQRSDKELEYKPRDVGLEDEDCLQRIPYPLMPGWLPKGYRLNAISPLDYKKDDEPLLVYQLDLYNPGNENVVSIFETRNKELEQIFKAGEGVGDEGYFVGTSKQGWIIAVFGSISQSQFDMIFEGLRQDDEAALEMIDRTLSREELKRWAEEVCTREADPVK